MTLDREFETTWFVPLAQLADVKAIKGIVTAGMDKPVVVFDGERDPRRLKLRRDTRMA
jgi:hypothetical protein